MHKVAIIGAGIGAEHLDGYLANQDAFDVTIICDLDEARAAPLAAKAKAHLVSDFDAVLRSDATLIDICLPPHLHFDFATRALEAGKHVVCEKPLVTSLAEADRLEETANATGGHVFPVFQYRYGLGMSQLHALRQAGLLGKAMVATLETHWNRDAEYYAIPWRGTWAGERGGALLGHAIHIHDLVGSILGPVSALHAMTATRVNDIETEDCAALSLTMASGALVTSSVTLGAADDTSRLRLVFEHVTVESDTSPYAPAKEAWRFQARNPARQVEIDAILNEVAPPKFGFAGFFEAVGEALAGRSGREVTLGDGRRALEFVTAAYASARSGQRVELPLTDDHPLYASWLPS